MQQWKTHESSNQNQLIFYYFALYICVNKSVQRLRLERLLCVSYLNGVVLRHSFYFKGQFCVFAQQFDRNGIHGCNLLNDVVILLSLDTSISHYKKRTCNTVFKINIETLIWISNVIHRLSNHEQKEQFMCFDTIWNLFNICGCFQMSQIYVFYIVH